MIEHPETDTKFIMKGHSNISWRLTDEIFQKLPAGPKQSLKYLPTHHSQIPSVPTRYFRSRALNDFAGFNTPGRNLRDEVSAQWTPQLCPSIVAALYLVTIWSIVASLSWFLSMEELMASSSLCRSDRSCILLLICTISLHSASTCCATLIWAFQLCFRILRSSCHHGAV